MKWKKTHAGWLVVTAIALACMLPGTATAKSLYMITNHHTAYFETWSIALNGIASPQRGDNLAIQSDPSGIGIDNKHKVIFISEEYFGGAGYALEMWDPVNHVSLGGVGSPLNAGGVDVREGAGTDPSTVYTVQRHSNTLHSWDYSGGTAVSNHTTVNLHGMGAAYGLAVDEVRNTLWVADRNATSVKGYDLDNLTAAPTTLATSHTPIDVAVDRQRGLLYTVGGWTGSNLITKTDLSTGTEVSTHNMGHRGVGIAVDETTGFLYVTGGFGGADDNMSAWDPSTWTELQDTGWLGTAPAGIAIPHSEISYNPLNLAKADQVGGETMAGTVFDFVISYDNAGNTQGVTGVTIKDELPEGLTYVSDDSGGSHSGGVIEWDIGTLAHRATGQIILTVQVGSGVPFCTTLTNYVQIGADDVATTWVTDDVHVGEIPEPVTAVVWSSILGMSGIALVLRRRRRSA